MIRQVSARASIEENPTSFAIRIRSGRTPPKLAAWLIGILGVAVLVLAAIAIKSGAILPLFFLPWIGLLLGYEAVWRGFGHEDVLSGEFVRIKWCLASD